jgi:hypothetical protein
MLTEDIYVSAPWAEILGTHAMACTSDANWEDLWKHGVAASFEEERVAPYNLFLMFRSSLDISYALCNRSLDIIANIAVPGPTSSRTTNSRIRFRDGEQGGSAREKEVRHNLGDLGSRDHAVAELEVGFT